MDAAVSSAGSVLLGDHEARLLAAHLERLRRWDAEAYVRVVVRPRALGVYAAPPIGVLSFVALPLARPGVDDLDVTVRAGELQARLAAAEPGSAIVLQVPLGVAGAPELGVLPPADGWQLPIAAVSGDLVPLVDEAVAEFRQRAVSSIDPAALADQIWDRPSFGGLSLRVLHAARRLGFLTDDACRVSAATRTGWKRLTTVRGQVFIRTTPAVRQPHLSVVR